jgi:DNA-binding transcriptional LysR family regulator
VRSDGEEVFADPWFPLSLLQSFSMNLQDLRYLVAVAEHRHFGRAAETCHVSQPTLSSQIRKLEQELGVTLLERTNKRVELTPVGSQVLAHAREALTHAAQMEAVARAARDPLVGPLKLGVIPTLAPYLMPMILKPLRDAYPGLTIELWEDQTRALIEGLRNYRLDAALLATALDAPEITEISLFEEPLLAALPANHRLAGEDREREGPDRRVARACRGTLPLEPGARGVRRQARGPAKRPPKLDAGRHAGDPGEPRGGGVWRYARTRAGAGGTRPYGYCAPAAGGEFVANHSSGEPSGVSATPGFARLGEGHPRGRERGAATPHASPGATALS